jgi:nitrate reductase gamma subunit
MVYRIMGLVHATLGRLARERRGQGTVEYVALILLVAAILAGVVAATRGQKFGATGIADAIVRQLKSALGKVH